MGGDTGSGAERETPAWRAIHGWIVRRPHTKNNDMDKQIEESEPKKQEEILSFGGVAISVKYAEQDDPHITEALKRSVFSYGFYNNICKT